MGQLGSYSWLGMRGQKSDVHFLKDVVPRLTDVVGL